MGWFSGFTAWLKPPAIKPMIIKPKQVMETVQNVNNDIPQCGVALIKSFEKCILIGYADQGGVPTDGWGNTFGARIGVSITQAQADADLIRNLGWAWLAVKKAVKVPLSQNQASALLSLIFNIGEGAFEKSSLLIILNSGNYAAIPNKIKQFIWITRNGQRQVSQGLVNRRKAEAALWCGADWRQL